jgi:serine/threonine protein kinase
MIPTILKARYVLSDEIRFGGMATVTRAFDISSNRACAVKVLNDDADWLRYKESFNREYAALTELSHPNILHCYDADVAEDGRYFMVFEWIPTNLEAAVREQGTLDWPTFFQQIGRPVLEGLTHAHRKHWVHRDLKPKNILITTDGTPKISDYGIGRRNDKVQLGLTFASFSSAPFTPPETDDGRNSFGRDCFSFAALSIFCLTGADLRDYAQLRAALESLGPDDAPTAVFTDCLSEDPLARPQHASALLAYLDAFEKSRAAASATTYTVHLCLSESVARQCQVLLDQSDRDTIERYFLDELNEVAAIQHVSFDATTWRILSGEWVFVVTQSPNGTKLTIVKAFRLSPTEAERHRERSFTAKVLFTFSHIRDEMAAKSSLQELSLALSEFHTAQQVADKEREKERVFRMYYAFLKAKANFQARPEQSIRYIDAYVNPPYVTLTAEYPASPEVIGEARVIRTSGRRPILCEVKDVRLDEITLIVTSGDFTNFPKKGSLELNTIAEEKALERQRAAIDAINYDRAASTRLKTLLVDPSLALAPEPVINVVISDPDFSDDKRAVLKTALGVQDVLAIKGPPGTGKTRLICEIIHQYLAANTEHRILLSSQTHTALDNVIDKVTQGKPDLEVVRIGRLDDKRISEQASQHLLERKLASWAAVTQRKARDFLTVWAKQRGLDHAEIEVGVLATRLMAVIDRVEQLTSDLAGLESRISGLELEADARLQHTGANPSSAMSEETESLLQNASDLRRERATLARTERESREALSKLGGYGREIANKGKETLAEWSIALLGTSEAAQQLTSLIALQQDWVLRLGRSSEFHAAVIATAKVVAGTCIGFAGVRGMSDISYDLCIIDEASKATATEILVPMARSRKWILVGDPEQLPPFFENALLTRVDEFESSEVRETLLERFLHNLPSHSVAELTEQHRMVKGIGDLISHCFYDKALVSRRAKQAFQLPGVLSLPVTWLSTSRMPRREESPAGKSFANDLECRLIRDLLGRVNFLAKSRRRHISVAVIAGYVAQVKALQLQMRDKLHEWENVTVLCNTVDAFQGSEADICIYSVTRANDENRLGFLREKPRLNVALSRGREFLVIVGDEQFARACEGENPARTVLEYIDSAVEACEIRVLESD